MSGNLFGGIEAGGTKFVCAVGIDPDDIRARSEFPTTSPQETIGRAVEFFRQHSEDGPLSAIGIGSFGPVDLNLKSPAYGHITSTPKAGWSNVDFVGAVRREMGIAVAFDTDVNAAAFGEYRWGAAKGLDTFVYLTVGTGIGGGAMVSGKLLHGLLHPEMGHIRVPHDLQADPYGGTCSYHGDCLEGLANGPALEGRWGIRGENLPDDHAAWELEAHYLALGLMNHICTLSPQKVILGGGVMARAAMYQKVRSKVRDFLNGYLQISECLEHIEDYIVPPLLGNDSGVLGAIALARAAHGA